MIFDTYNGDYYFPWEKIDKYILNYDETNNSERIKSGIKKIQLKLINKQGDIKYLFESEFGIKF
jgi:hypothetical protein